MKNLSRFLFCVVLILGMSPLGVFAVTNQDSVFLQKARKLLKATASLSDNQGVSVGLSGSAFVAGTGIAVDAINFNGDVAFFCSSSLSLKIENGAGLTKDLNYVSTRGCEVPSRYEGLFMTISGSGGVDFLAKGAVGGAVSYGLSFVDLSGILEKNFIRNSQGLDLLLSEIVKVASCLKKDSSSQLIRFYLQSILKYLEILQNKITDTETRKEISFEISRAKRLLDKQPTHLSCGFDKVSENLRNNSKKFFEYSKESSYDSKLASLLPSKDKLALIVESSLDSDHFPFLSKLLLDVLRLGMSGCDSVTAGLSLGVGSNKKIAPTISAGLSVSSYKKIGPTLRTRELRDAAIDRYVQRDGVNRFIGDTKEGFSRVCSETGKCAWKAACMLTDREAFIQGVKKSYVACTETAVKTVAFLNGMYECFRDNYKDITLRPYEILSKVGNEP